MHGVWKMSRRCFKGLCYVYKTPENIEDQKKFQTENFFEPKFLRAQIGLDPTFFGCTIFLHFTLHEKVTHAKFQAGHR